MYKDFYVGDCVEQFLCISEENKVDLAAGRYFLEPRIAIEMGEISELPFFQVVCKLVLLPGEVTGSCMAYFRGCSASHKGVQFKETQSWTI